MFRTNHYNVEISSSSEALQVASTEPEFHPSYRLILAQPVDAARKTRYHLCLAFGFGLGFLCEHKLGSFRVISHKDPKTRKVP